MGFFDDGAVETAGGRRVVLSEIVDEDLAIDLRRVGRSAGLPEQLGFFAGPFEHDFDLASDPLLAALAADALLQLHKLAAAAFDHFGRNFVCEMEGGRALLVGVGEDAEPVKLRGSDESTELLEIIVGLARESDDERSAQGESGHRLAHFGDELEENFRRAAALHALENRGRGVLQGKVDIAAKAWMAGEYFQQARRDLVGIGVEEANPAELVDLRELFEQRGETILNAEVFAEAGCVLPDEIDFANALRGQPPGLGDDRGDGARAELAA